MPNNGYSLVVPDYDPPHDVEANPLLCEFSTRYEREIVDDDFFCSCLPSYDTITFFISETLDNFTDFFYEVLYGEDDDNEKDV